jgi:hypothetical protein
MVAMFVNGSARNVQSLQRIFHRCYLPSFGSFGQAVLEKHFRNRPTRNKNIIWPPRLLTDRHEMSYLYREPSIDAPYQISVSEEMIFLKNNQPEISWPFVYRSKQNEQS